jgi:hypothetical protein
MAPSGIHPTEKAAWDKHVPARRVWEAEAIAYFSLMNTPARCAD